MNTNSIKDLMKGMGLIAPDGRFVPCDHRAHISTAVEILVNDYGVYRLGHTSAIESLRKLGWVIVWSQFIIGPIYTEDHKHTGTYEQVETAYDIARWRTKHEIGTFTDSIEYLKEAIDVAKEVENE